MRAKEDENPERDTLYIYKNLWGFSVKRENEPNEEKEFGFGIDH